MTVDVPIRLTQELIDRRGEECPVEAAAKAAMPGAMITVSAGHIWIDAPGLSVSVRLPWEIRNILDAIDSNNNFAVEPRVFTLPIPREVAELPGFLADETLLSPPALEPMPL